MSIPQYYEQIRAFLTPQKGQPDVPKIVQKIRYFGHDALREQWRFQSLDESRGSRIRVPDVR